MIPGARQFFSMKGAAPMKQIVLTQTCENCKQLTDHIIALCASEGITNAMCSVVASEARNNLVGVAAIVNGSIAAPLLRYRNGAWGVASPIVDYDADARIGDIYNVYVPSGLWNSANLNGGGRECLRFSQFSFSRSSRLWKEAA
jgi:hypothetical protein